MYFLRGGGGGRWYGLSAGLVWQEFFKPTFWTIFSEIFILNFFWCFFLEFIAMYWFAEAGGGIKRFLLKWAFSGFIVRQVVKIFKPTFWTIFFWKKIFFCEFFFDSTFWIFSRCIGFQRRGVVSNASLWSGLSADYSPTSCKIF